MKKVGYIALNMYVGMPVNWSLTTCATYELKKLHLIDFKLDTLIHINVKIISSRSSSLTFLTILAPVFYKQILFESIVFLVDLRI